MLRATPYTIRTARLEHRGKGGLAEAPGYDINPPIHLPTTGTTVAVPTSGARSGISSQKEEPSLLPQPDTKEAADLPVEPQQRKLDHGISLPDREFTSMGSRVIYNDTAYRMEPSRLPNRKNPTFLITAVPIINICALNLNKAKD